LKAVYSHLAQPNNINEGKTGLHNHDHYYNHERIVFGLP
jgi:hypothetical protein